MRNKFRMSALAVALALSASGAQAKTYHFKFFLSGAQETPPHAVKGKGFGTATYDDKTHDLTWDVSFKGLTGDPTMAHFHGPAKPGKAAKVQVAVSAMSGAPLISPIIGSATLSDEQAKDLLAGLYYFNIHTAANPKGEIRGQVVKAVYHAAKPTPVAAAKPMVMPMSNTMMMAAPMAMAAKPAPAKPVPPKPAVTAPAKP